MTLTASLAYAETPAVIHDGHVLVTLSVVNSGADDARCVIVTPAEPLSGPFEHDEFPMFETVPAGQTVARVYYAQVLGTADLPELPEVDSVQTFGPPPAE